MLIRVGISSLSSQGVSCCQALQPFNVVNLFLVDGMCKWCFFL